MSTFPPTQYAPKKLFNPIILKDTNKNFQRPIYKPLPLSSNAFNNKPVINQGIKTDFIPTSLTAPHLNQFNTSIFPNNPTNIVNINPVQPMNKLIPMNANNNIAITKLNNFSPPISQGSIVVKGNVAPRVVVPFVSNNNIINNQSIVARKMNPISLVSVKNNNNLTNNLNNNINPINNLKMVNINNTPNQISPLNNSTSLIQPPKIINVNPPINSNIININQPQPPKIINVNPPPNSNIINVNQPQPPKIINVNPPINSNIINVNQPQPPKIINVNVPGNTSVINASQPQPPKIINVNPPPNPNIINANQPQPPKIINVNPPPNSNIINLNQPQPPKIINVNIPPNTSIINANQPQPPKPFNMNIPPNTSIMNANKPPNTSIISMNPQPINTITPISNPNTITYKNSFVEPGEQIDLKEFELLGEIGKGSFGKIYKVRWKVNQKFYALKSEILDDPNDINTRLNRGKAMRNFVQTTGCQGVVNILGSYVIKRGPTIQYFELMELCEGDFEKEIKMRSNFGSYYTEGELDNIIKQLISTLSFLQKRHITHRDIKPQNILISNGKYRLCDFGDIRVMQRDGYVIQRIRGSELYMSPILFNALRSGVQQVEHNTYKSDVFSLGMCLFYAACLSFDGPVEIREIVDMNMKLQILNKYLGARYSQKLIKIFYLMLLTEESIRPDFIMLEDAILKYGL